MTKEIKPPTAEEFEASLDRAQEWASSAGYLEEDVDGIIKSVRRGKIKRPLAIDEMTKDEFDEMMREGLEQAKAGIGADADEVFERLIGEISRDSKTRRE